MASGFVFLASYYHALKELPDGDRLSLYDAIACYGVTGREPELCGIQKAFFSLIKPNIDSSGKKYAASVENGRKGGRPKARSETQSKPNQNLEATEEEPSQYLKKEMEKENEIEKEMECEKEKVDMPPAHLLGHFKNVLLSSSELDELQVSYPEDWEDYVERLSGHIASTGKRYANHYATIRKWLTNDGKMNTGQNEEARLCSL